MQRARQRYPDGKGRSAHATSISVHLRHRVAVLHHSLDQAAVALTDTMSPTAIHNTCMAARRLRVLLRTYRKEFDSEEGVRYMRHLKGLTRDLEVAREADVTRHAIIQLGRNRRGRMNSYARALQCQLAQQRRSRVDVR